MRKEAENWFRQSKADLKTAKNSFNSKDYYASIFWCQQAVEKALKSRILEKKSELMKFHDLVNPRKNLQSLDWECSLEIFPGLTKPIQKPEVL